MVKKPKILKRLVKQLQAKGISKKKVYGTAINALRRSGNLKKRSLEPTKKGIQRGNMTPATRAISRASKYTGKPISAFRYNKKTNRAILKKR